MADASPGPEIVVSRWIDGFNLRELGGMPECMGPELRGRDGVTTT